ncbi:MAG: nucleotidyltransferase family protein [Thermoleophilaceae bacterium]
MSVPPPSEALLATARSLAVDRVTGEVVAALRRARVPSLLLKGPTVASWLYDDGAVRSYIDSDLWVPPVQIADAERVLTRLGFEPGVLARPPEPGEVPHARPWFRHGSAGEVDLHHTVSGVGVAPEEAWKQLSAIAEEMEVGGQTVAVLPIPARALLVVFHAAQHGPDKPKPLEDLARAVERAPDDVWLEAARIAARLDATPTLGDGLRLLPAGAALADRLRFATSELVATARGPNSKAPLALGFQRLSEARTLGERMRLVRREVFPSPDFLRWWSPLARRGRIGLAAAYVWRPLWLLRHAAPSLVAWRRSRRAAGS